MAKRKPPTEKPERESAAVERRVDELYRGPPEEFVAARDALAKELRGESEPEAAKRVRALRRPSQAAWLINRVSLDEPKRIERLATAGEKLRDAQQQAVESGGGGAELRSAATRERDEIAALVEAAREVAREGGRRVTERVFDQVGETLQASGTDPELRDRISRGRVQKESSAATLGTFADAAPPRRPTGGRRGKATAGRGAKSAVEDRALERAKRELKRLRDQLATSEARMEDAEQRVERAQSDLKSAKSSLTDRRREAQRLSREVKAAEKRISGR